MKSLAYYIILFFFLTVKADNNNNNDFRCDYTYFGKINGYPKLHVVPANWHEARLKCPLEDNNNNNDFRCDYTYFANINGYLKLHVVPANWHEARLRCHLEGAILASPLTYELGNAMKELIDQVNDGECGVFTGIHATFSRGDFVSVEGVPLSRIAQNWMRGEPDNENDEESCLAMTSDGLADVKCSEPHPYICFRKKPYNRVTECGTIDQAYTLDRNTGSCYKFHRVPRTWSRAYMACLAEGGHLAIINSDAEAQSIKKLIAKNPPNSMVGNFQKDYMFVGFHDWNEHGEWLTINGETLTEAGYDKFLPGEPNNSSTGQYCGAVYRSALFDDIWCQIPHAFICEKNPNSLVNCYKSRINFTNFSCLGVCF